GLVHELKLAAGRRLEIVELVGQAPVRVVQKVLPGPPVPPEPGPRAYLQGDCIVRARDLKQRKYTLKIDGDPVHTADAATWMTSGGLGVIVPKGPSLEQVEKMRHTIIEKNRLYFHRWRPQNETYLFGFRKYEQGQ